MTTKTTGANLMPAMAAAGAVLLIGALALSYLAQGRSGAPTDRSATTLQRSQSAILAARTALQSGTEADHDALSAARGNLARLNTQGLTSEQAKAFRNLVASLDTLDNNWPGRELLTFVDAEIAGLLPELEAAADEVEQSIIIQDRAAAVAQLDRLRLLGDGLQQGVGMLVAAARSPADVSQDLLDKEMALTQIVRGFENGDPVLGLRAVSDEQAAIALAGLAATAGQLSDSVRNVLAITDQLAALQVVGQQLNGLEAVLGTTVANREAGGPDPLDFAAMALTAVAIVIFGVIAWLWYRQRDIRRAAQLQTEQTQRNQAAIMRLLDELGSLADGDLTVKATVTEDITGAIADSINYAIEALRELVATLNDSAIRVDGAARQTDATAEQLAEAAAEQSKQIEDASQAILSMAASIEEISGNAERSSDVARHSVDVAHKGGDAVRRTIEGMNTIRETIQDTAKRIKRLGESSQEIGNIVELINDIADQTNILALNASIQASTAGEAGRGFAVVADEVQRLAERSANATKQIEVLVRTIQTDTNEAVVSMERSTTDVVGGALLAENAGAALEEIEQVSNQIASLVQNISVSSREQSAAAASVTRNVDMLQGINSRTQASTSATTGAIRELAELAAQLRESVAGFRLPDDDEPEQPPYDEPELDDAAGYRDASIAADTDSEEVKFAGQQTA